MPILIKKKQRFLAKLQMPM